MTLSSSRRTVRVGLLTTATLVSVVSASAATVAAVFARRLITPNRERPCDAEVLAVDVDADGRPVRAIFAPSVESEAPGRYGLYWNDEAGHARIGGVVARTESGGVVRAVDAVTRGLLGVGPARWSGYYVDGSPQDAFGIPTDEVDLPGECGPAPAWVTRAGDGRRWAVLVHGRGARRTETVRAVPVLDDLGISTVIPTYRNDVDGPPSRDGRYALGLSEWAEVDQAVRFAVDQGAERVDLLGWSMGGALVLQFLARSSLAAVVGTVFLDGPVLDWADVMAHHARLNRLPPGLATFAARLLGHRFGHRLVGSASALDVRLADWVARAGELTRPMVIVHSVDDEFVPFGPTARLARRRPDLVTWHRWEGARHVREWNVDSTRWERLLRAALSA